MTGQEKGDFLKQVTA